MSLTQGIGPVITLAIVLGFLYALAARRRALAVGRAFPMSHAIGAGLLAGGVGAVVGALTVVALNALVPR